MTGIKAVFIPILCDDVAGYIENLDIRNRWTDVHAEYFKKLAKYIEKKLNTLELDIRTYYRKSPYDNQDDLTGDPKYDLWYNGLVSRYNKSCVLVQILDDIFYNSGKVVNSEHREIWDFNAIFEDLGY
tara:strand:+ start:227 stop:610 length:384 start_codon:yes stop_codon:yes gene_type:complete